MCHDLTWEQWQVLQQLERRADEEARIVEVTEREVVEAETEREPHRELVHA